MKKCELLIPAGGKKQFVSAVENGADAVYVGGKNFNARMNAENFYIEELEQAIDYGHLRNVKTYITMNTLLEEHELEPALYQAAEYYKIGADGVIIQDIGLGLLIKENIPSLSIHLSTQAGVYDARGVMAAAHLGYERVVLARELSLEEIKKAVNTGIEIEVFVHGALCMCYSGQCQLSRVIGGRSGNKGGCAQPCRLPYMGAAGEPYPLSPKDLCLLDEIGILADAGVSSLKVEGRMKSAEYVAVVTSIYRKYLDRWYDFGKYRVDEEDLTALKQIFNRGGFTKGYFYGDPGQNLMSSDFSKNAGIFVGNVFKDSMGPLVDIKTEKEILKGDYVEIRSSDVTSNLVTYAEKLTHNCIRIGDIKQKVRKGDKVYKLVSGSLMEDARKTFENIDFSQGKYLRKVPVDMEVSVVCGKPIALKVSCCQEDDNIVTVKKEGAVLQSSKNNISCKESLMRQLTKTGGTPFVVSNIEVEEDTPCYIPVSSINQLRREALSELSDKIIASYKREYTLNTNILPTAGEKEEKAIELFFYSADDLQKCNLHKLMRRIREILGDNYIVKVLVPLYQYKQCIRELYGAKLVPYILSMNKGSCDDWIENNISDIAEMLENDNSGIYIGNIGWIEPFTALGVKVYGDSGLNISNSHSMRAYKKLGMIHGQNTLEKEENGFGSFPLMITEHKFKADKIVDRKGEGYKLNFFDDIHKTILLKNDDKIDWKQFKNAADNGKESIRIYVTDGSF